MFTREVRIALLTDFNVLRLIRKSVSQNLETTSKFWPKRPMRPVVGAQRCAFYVETVKLCKISVKFHTLSALLKTLTVVWAANFWGTLVFQDALSNEPKHVKIR